MVEMSFDVFQINHLPQSL